jgi:DNA-binding GntR family transcriptional regulator
VGQDMDLPKADDDGSMPASSMPSPHHTVAGSRSVANPPGYYRVRDAIRDDIISGYFGDESRLVISALCERYEVTAPPIREALNQLEVEGLIVLSANRGARVRKFDAQFVSEIFEIRIALEPELVWRSVPLMTADDIRALERIEAQFEAASAAGDGQSVSLLNRDFHRRIYEARPNREAIRLLTYHEGLIRTLRNRFGYRRERVHQIIEEHRQLVRACADHDAERARAIARTHIEHSVADLQSLLASRRPGEAALVLQP